MTEAVTDAVLTIAEPGQPIDLHMVRACVMSSSQPHHWKGGGLLFFFLLLSFA
jgi:hypothetical protein